MTVAAEGRAPQGMRLKVRGVPLVNGVSLSDAVILEGTAPDVVEVVSSWARAASSLRAWNLSPNRWGAARVGRQRCYARVSVGGNQAEPRCSDADGDSDFVNLVVLLTMQVD